MSTKSMKDEGIIMLLYCDIDTWNLLLAYF